MPRPGRVEGGNERLRRVVVQAMTAISEADRLDGAGIWRADGDSQRQNVRVSLGDATLVIHANDGQALAHWSLAAVTRLNPSKRPARFAPGEGADEELEITDDTLADAIERVRRAVERQEPRPGRLRRLVVWLLVLSVLGGVAWWLPDAMVRHTGRIVPEAKRAEIGASLFAHIRRSAGVPCVAPRGQRALDQLDAKLRGPAARGVRVMPEGLADPVHLPGGMILLGRSAVEDVEEVEATAGYILAEATRAEARDPIQALLDWAGPWAAFGLLTKGDAPDQILSDYAETLLTRPPHPVSDAALLARFEAARVPARPYALARDISGETTLALIEADAIDPAPDDRLLADADWIALQDICAN